MATWIDLSKRLENGVNADERLHVHAGYHGAPLPQWLANQLSESMAHCDGRIPIVVLNWKTSAVDDALVAMTLADLERLIGE